MARIAAIISGANFRNPKGLMNAAMNRIYHLEKVAACSIDIFAISTKVEKASLTNFFRRECAVEDIIVDGRTIHLLTKVERRSGVPVIRRILKIYHKAFKQRLSDWEWQKHFAKYLKGYDALSVHSTDAAIIAQTVNARYGIPFFVTWHGSDIHTIPFEDTSARKKTIEAIENASCNFFVSWYLKETSAQLTAKGRKEILYNGVGDCFVRFDKEDLLATRQSLGLSDEKVVTFAGNLREIKNAAILPDIFNAILRKYNGPLFFWIIGDGPMKNEIKRRVAGYGLTNVVFWGDQPGDKMPVFLNCTDVLVLPSKNEGLPLAALEALACGSNVAGSIAGGIPEAIGQDFCISFGDDFAVRFADRVVELLASDIKQELRPEFSWDYTAEIESEIMKGVLGE